MQQHILIAAIDIKGGIGKDGYLPWYCPADLRLFKQHTINQTIVIGHNTFKGMWQQQGKILPDRQTIVVCRNPYPQNLKYRRLYKASQLVFTSDLDAVNTLANRGTDICYCGGAQIYRQVFDRIDSMYLSRIPAEYSCDTFFPGTPAADDGDLYEPVIPPHLQLFSSEKIGLTDQSFTLETYQRALA